MRFWFAYQRVRGIKSTQAAYAARLSRCATGDGSEQFRMNLVLFGIIVVGLTSWALNALARGVERRVIARRSGAPRERAVA
ncbi:hypothetical protein QFZ99_000110 [Paraburkholderia atlantica]